MATYSVKNSNSRFTLTLTVTEDTPTSSQVASNQSTIHYSLVLKANTAYNFELYKIGRTVSIGGTTVYSVARSDSTSLSIADYGSLTLASGSKTFTHNSDGSLSLAISYSIDMASADYTPGALSGNGTFICTTIPRTTTITATDAKIGSASTITLNRATTSFTHKLEYSINGGSSWTEIASGVASDSYGWNVPLSLYEKIPSEQSIVVNIKCTTFSGSTTVGEHKTSMTALIDSSVCSPTITDPNVKDVNVVTTALTGDSSVFIKYFSNIYCDATVSSKQYATLSTKFVRCGDGKQVDTIPGTIYAIESGTFYFRATDSRGCNASYNHYTDASKFVDYVKLSCVATFYRPSPTTGEVSVDYSGNYYNGKFGNANNAAYNTLTIKWYYRLKGSPTWTEGGILTPVKSGNTYSGSVSLGTSFTYTNSYEFKMEYADKLMNSSVSMVVPQGLPVFDWGENDFNINGDLSVSGDVTFKGNVFGIPSVPTATTSTSGTVKIDGSTITINNGTISAKQYSLPTASTSTLGGVKVDGSSIAINNGVISAAQQSSLSSILSNASGTATSHSFTPSNYGLIILGLTPSSSGAVVFTAIPAVLASGGVTFQIADESDYCKWTLSSTGVTRASGSGYVRYIYGLKL